MRYHDGLPKRHHSDSDWSVRVVEIGEVCTLGYNDLVHGVKMIVLKLMLDKCFND